VLDTLQHIDNRCARRSDPLKSRIACQIKAVGAETAVQTLGPGLGKRYQSVRVLRR
jgi:hypothetical protein